MIVTYEGADITEEVTLERCVYEACEIGRAPWLSIEFIDNAGLWDRWNPQHGDRVTVIEPGIAAPGTMYVDRLEPQSGGYALHATALPSPDLRAVREWRDTTLLTVAGQLAGVLGLGFEAHGCADMAIAYARQNNECAAAVLTRLAFAAGCTIDVYDGAMHLCAREWVDSRPTDAALVLGDESDYSYAHKALFASCSIEQPASTAAPGLSEATGGGEPRLAVVLDGNIAFPGSSELKRACAGVLASENAKRSVGYVRGNALSPFSPGVACSVDCARTPSLAGSGIVTRVRNDFVEQTSKTWWRAT
ncbi:MAG: hypothetical protein IJ087_03715 [Eggerthellaceae bacterium]|nr:hypothetical protein [Eggerthellaceae bacterium]